MHWKLHDEEDTFHEEDKNAASPNTAYTPRVYALALREIAPFGHNVVYAGNVKRHFWWPKKG
jgi:hypothetical protein